MKKTISHFRNLGRICSKNGLGAALAHDFDKSVFRVFVPYASETIPAVLGISNYRTLTGRCKDDLFAKPLCGVLATGSEAARYIATAVTLNETGSFKSATAAYLLTTAFFSMKNQLRIDRFYRNPKLTGLENS